MRDNLLKERFKANKITHGLFCSLNEPTIIEMVGEAGYDFAILEMEHSSLGMPEIQHMVRAAELANITPIVRVPQHSPGEFIRAAETGAQGVLVPHVCSAQEARELVNAIKFPPFGERGMSGTTRAAKFSSTLMQDHMVSTNNNILAMVMIEDKKAVENLKEILQVDGLDVIFIGPSDLSREYGVPGQTDHPKVKEIIEYIFDVAKNFPHIKIGIPAFNISDVPERVRNGAHMITCPPSDTKLLFSSLKNSLIEIKGAYSTQ